MTLSVRFPSRDMSVAELTAAVLDGDLVPLGEGFVAADAPETPWLRLQAIAPVLGRTMAATHALAAWVWGARAEAPTILTVQRALPHRVKVTPRARVAYRDGYVGEADLVWHGQAAVTSCARTIADLARSREFANLNLMIACHPDHVEAAIEWCERHRRLVGARNAHAVLTTCLSELPRTG